MKKILSLFVLGMFLFSLGSVYAIETLGTFKQLDTIRLPQVCDDATYITISSVTYPNSSTAISNVNMTSSGSGEFYYNFSSTSDLGRYDVKGISDGCEGTFAYYFEITVTGKGLDQSKSSSYIAILIISILIFFGLLWMGMGINGGNNRDEMTGYIIAIRNIKYLKYTLLGLSYITLIWIMYYAWAITYAYLDFLFLSNIFRFMFYFLAILTLPLFILYTYITIANLVRDSKIKDMLLRGLSVKG